MTVSDPPSFFGLKLSTHRAKELGPEALSFFPFEAEIAAISIFFFRTTVHFKDEPAPLRFFFAVLLACLAYCKKSYELIMAVEIFSYAVPWLLQRRSKTRQSVENESSAASSGQHVMLQLLSIGLSAAASLLVSHFIASGDFGSVMRMLTPNVLMRLVHYLFPVAEITEAYNIMAALGNPLILHKQIHHLLFVTFHIQVGIGYLGIEFLITEQDRRNQLVRMDLEDGVDKDRGSLKGRNDPETRNGQDKSKANGSNGKEKPVSAAMMERAKRFQRGAAPFIVFTALPYMFQVIAYGNINKFAFSCLQNDMHRVVRLNELFDHDNHLTAMATESPTSPDAYAASLDAVVDTAYDIFNRKLFSLPKVMLLPGVMSRQPLLVLQVFPFIFLADWIKASSVAFMTTKVEELEKETKELVAVRNKVESFDIKNAALLQRSGRGATQFTQTRWEELTVRIQERAILKDLLSRSKMFFSFIQRNFVFSVLIDCALANLIALGKIVSAETFVFSRAIEDAVDMILMRSRGEAELARMMTEIDKLKQLADIWDRSKSRSVLHCRLPRLPEHKSLVLRNLHYSRGTASVRADHVELAPGVYALTGANGSGKSTLFSILMGCDTNEKSIDLPSSINLLTPAEPLTEEDDLIRQTACEVPDDEEDEECEAGYCANDRSLSGGEVAKEANSTTSISPDPSVLRDTEMPHAVPKLSILMPSSHVVEISQTFYWPLYSKPIDWIYQEHVSETCEPSELSDRARRVAEELHSLEFFQLAQVKNDGKAPTDDEDEDDNDDDKGPTDESTILRIMQELQEDKEDWFGDLSGGQRSKVELVRKVFLQEHCPDVLLVDETMAPLDPASKALVMAKLKKFCFESVIIVIYHTDVGQGKEVDGEETEACVPSNDFFDMNVHLEHGILHLKETC